MADYAITNVARRIVYTGSAGVGPYAFSFPIIVNTDIAVYKNDAILTLTTDYTVTISGTTGTGSVTLVSAATGSDRITIVGARAIERSTDFVTGGDFFANTLNTELDSEVIFVQQVAETAERSLKAPVTDPTTINMTLPLNTVRANKTLAFDADGNPVVGEQIGDYRGNWAAGTATALQNARTITVGATGRSFNGTADISWSLADIGAQAAGSYVTTNTYQNITGYKEFASYGSGNKTGFLCNNATTGFMFMQNVSTGKTWDWEILSNGTLSLNESGVSARLQLFAAGGGRVFGNMTADAFFEASDIRYKDVIHTNPVVDLSSIDVIKYKFTDDLNGQVRYGYSAQSIQAVLPELVQEKDERLYLNYSDVHTLKIAALEKRVKELELKLGI